MGVPKFYRWTSERYPCLSEVINETQIPEFDNLYLDMNGIIHNCSHPNDDDVTFRITEEEIFQSIFTYIENLYNIIRPQKVFFMAVDGVAPRAKMNQQRARRFMSARTAEFLMKKAVEKGDVLPTDERFDSNCITPGTFFMTRLHTRLAEWVDKKIANDSHWQNRRIFLSGHNCPGEGEHKIMDFIRSERTKNDYDPNTRHCMYGLDADLIMLGIVSHEPHFSLLREEVTFNRPSRRNDSKKQKVAERNDTDAKKFHLLHLSILREYLAWEFSSVKPLLPFDYDMERIVDDWILMGLLVGNDFLPHLPNIHIHDDALPLLYRTYKTVLPKLDGYINEGGYLNLVRFEKFLEELSRNDKSVFMSQLEDQAFLDSKAGPNELEKDELQEYEGLEDGEGEELEPSNRRSQNLEEEEEEEDNENAAFVDSDFEDEEEGSQENVDRNPEYLDDAAQLEEDFSEELALADFMAMDEKDFENDVEACWTRTINNQFKKFRKNYYSEKLKFRNISKDQIREQAEGYVKAIQWNLHYYYHGCISWSWFYPHHYSPYISDIRNFANMEMVFNLSKPFQPFEQLLAVLPSASKSCVPAPLQELMTNRFDLSDISDFYPMTFETDLNGKKNEWEAVVLIPFIEEDRLLDAMRVKYNRLSQEEKQRNEHGPHLLFETVNDASGNALKVRRTEIDKDLYRIKPFQVKWGLLPNVKMDVFYPGFPTMKHLPHLGELKPVNVNVFGSASKRDSMVLKVLAVPKRDIIDWAAELLEEEVCIDWPILKLGKVDMIWGDDRIVKRTEQDEIVVRDMNQEEKKQWVAHVNHCTKQIMTRYAIDVEVGEKEKLTKIPLVWVRRFVGLAYQNTVDANGAPVMRGVKQFQPRENSIPVLLPLVVKDLLLEESRRLGDISIHAAFPLQKVAWVTDPKSELYGIPSMIQGYQNENRPNCTIKLIGMVFESQVKKMEELRKMYDAKCMRWLGGYECGQKTNIAGGLFARITGTIIFWNEARAVVEKGQQISSDNKINIGLGLKYSKRNLCVANYTKREETITERGPRKYWVYSNLTVQLVSNYKKKFPELFKFLETSSDTDDVYYAEDVWKKKETRDRKFGELKEFLDNLPSLTEEKLDCESEYADRQIIMEIERALGARLPEARMKQTDVPPTALFRAELYDGKTLVDASADFQILDRVACAGIGYPVPKTMQGTIVGIHGDKIDVLFDQDFTGGSHVRGSTKASSIRLPRAALFNLTYGLERIFKVPKAIAPKKSENKEPMNGVYMPYTPKPKNAAPSTSTPKEKTKKEKITEITESLNNLLKIVKPEPEPETKGKKISIAELMGASSSSVGAASSSSGAGTASWSDGKPMDESLRLAHNPVKSITPNVTPVILKNKEPGANQPVPLMSLKEEPPRIPTWRHSIAVPPYTDMSLPPPLIPPPQPQPQPQSQSHSQPPFPNPNQQPQLYITPQGPMMMAPDGTMFPPPFQMAQTIVPPMGQFPVAAQHQHFGNRRHRQNQHQQQVSHNKPPPLLTDFKPSTISRGSNKKRGGATSNAHISKPSTSTRKSPTPPPTTTTPKAQAEVVPSTSSTSAKESKSSSQNQSSKSRRKKKQSRLAVKFDVNNP